jgi:signal transduction histidine kinase/HAMP domain-containing protein
MVMAGSTGRRYTRGTLTARLFIGGMIITVALVASVSTFLLVSRALQSDQAVRSEATNRATTGYQLLVHVTQPQTQFAATSLATAPAMEGALSITDPAARVAAVADLFASGSVAALPGSRVAVFDGSGAPVYTDECGTGVDTTKCAAQPGVHLAKTTQSVAMAFAEGARTACAVPAATVTANPALTTTCPPGYEGVELIGGSLPAFDAAVDVRDGANRFLGVVVFSTTMQAQFHRLGAALLYTPVMFTGTSSPQVYRFDPTHDYAMSHAAFYKQLAPALSHRPASFDVEYPTPAAGQVASSVLAVTGPDGKVSAYMGVEVPTSVFAGQTGNDMRTIVLIGITAIVLVTLLIALFASRFVIGPIARLERGVRHIAEGDLSSDIPVTTDDELGRLAGSVNRMRGQIAAYIGHLDGSIQRLESVSHALTTTGEGVETLQRSVIGAAAAIGGEGAQSALFSATEGVLNPSLGSAQGSAGALGPADTDLILAGRHVRSPNAAGPSLLAVPMLYHGEVQGALAVWSRQRLSDSDEKALAALANNASVALENTRLFEQERHTVQRLRELDVMKNNFLTTTQHELRTPVLVIKGEIELMTAAWQELDEATKLDLVKEMEISARLLNEIVENIVVFSLVNSEAISLHTEAVDAATAINAAAAQLRDNHKNQLPVDLVLRLEPGCRVLADRERFEQVIRALLDNAVKFSPNGGVVRVLSRGAGDHCRIDVSDEGIGIDAEELPTVFDHLSQVDGSKTRRFGGMGMGLALVRRLSEVHGAQVTVTSTPGSGSCFTLHWPLAQEEREDRVRAV